MELLEAKQALREVIENSLTADKAAKKVDVKTGSPEDRIKAYELRDALQQGGEELDTFLDKMSVAVIVNLAFYLGRLEGYVYSDAIDEIKDDLKHLLPADLSKKSISDPDLSTTAAPEEKLDTAVVEVSTEAPTETTETVEDKGNGNLLPAKEEPPADSQSSSQPDLPEGAEATAMETGESIPRSTNEGTKVKTNGLDAFFGKKRAVEEKVENPEPNLPAVSQEDLPSEKEEPAPSKEKTYKVDDVLSGMV